MRRYADHVSSNSMDAFWRSYIQIGVVTYSLGALVVFAYAMATSDVPHRTTLRHA